MAPASGALERAPPTPVRIRCDRQDAAVTEGRGPRRPRTGFGDVRRRAADARAPRGGGRGPSLPARAGGAPPLPRLHGWPAMPAAGTPGTEWRPRTTAGRGAGRSRRPATTWRGPSPACARRGWPWRRRWWAATAGAPRRSWGWGRPSPARPRGRVRRRGLGRPAGGLRRQLGAGGGGDDPARLPPTGRGGQPALPAGSAPAGGSGAATAAAILAGNLEEGADGRRRARLVRPATERSPAPSTSWTHRRCCAGCPSQSSSCRPGRPPRPGRAAGLSTAVEVPGARGARRSSARPRWRGPSSASPPACGPAPPRPRARGGLATTLRSHRRSPFVGPTGRALPADPGADRHGMAR